MDVRPDQLENRLKSGMAPVYLIAGEEPLLVIEAADSVRRFATQAGFVERELLSNAESGFDWDDLQGASRSQSLFADKRRIEVDMSKSPGRQGAAALKAYAKTPPEGVLLLIVAGKLDKSARQSAWFKALSDAGVSVYAWPVRAHELGSWLQQRARSMGLVLADAALAELQWRVEGNLLAAAQALQRLKLLAQDGQAGVAEVAEAVGDAARFDSFDLLEPILVGDAGTALRRLQRLREEGVAVPAILGTLGWALHGMGLAAAARSASEQEAAWRTARIFGHQRRAQFAAALRRLGPAGLVAAQRLLALAERVAKGAQADAAGTGGWPELIRLCAGMSGTSLPRARRQRGLA